MNALLDYYEDYKQRTDEFTDDDKRKIAELRIVTAKLLGNVVKLDIPVEKKDDTLKTLLEDINNALARNKPTLVLDRLHTFATKLLRQICTDNGITVVDDKARNLPLQSLAGMLKKHYEQNNVFDSDFTPLAVKNNIALFDRFNAIRNDQSYAHDNEVLGNMEAEFVVRTMINTITFIDTIERYRKAPKPASQPEEFDWDSDELPF
ncbi:MAG: abortive infection family protein [Bacillota bacterium]